MNHAAISWWRKGILYQSYPRSFQDSNGDGIGDLPGIINRMPYLLDLGVNAVWLSPNFPSPMIFAPTLRSNDPAGIDLENYSMLTFDVCAPHTFTAGRRDSETSRFCGRTEAD
jgi:hypothetical protein